MDGCFKYTELDQEADCRGLEKKWWHGQGEWKLTWIYRPNSSKQWERAGEDKESVSSEWGDIGGDTKCVRW